MSILPFPIDGDEDDAYDADTEVESASQSRSGGSVDSDSGSAGLGRWSAVNLDLGSFDDSFWLDEFSDITSNKVRALVDPEDPASCTAVTVLPIPDEPVGAHEAGSRPTSDMEEENSKVTTSHSSDSELEGPFLFATHHFVSTWAHDSPTEIIIAGALSEWSDIPGKDGFHILSYHLRLSHSGIELVKATRSPARTIPWGCGSDMIRHNGCITTLSDNKPVAAGLPYDTDGSSPRGTSLMQYTLFGGGSEQPVRRLVLDEEIVPRGSPVLTTMDPWSGVIAVRMPGVLRVVRIAH